jgi:hypothetical protein
MNFRLRGRYSVILMSVQPNAPYRDRIDEDGSVLIYEGHDIPKTAENLEPKRIDQPLFLPTGGLTENGKFHKAAQDYKISGGQPHLVKVYEKIKKGIWSDNGYFQLMDSWVENDGKRKVFKFKLFPVEEIEAANTEAVTETSALRRNRIIPTQVKLEVWKRDGGKCVLCGASDELHFDHILPFSKGGTSLKSDNVQLLCARHNLEKSAKIQ